MNKFITGISVLATSVAVVTPAFAQVEGYNVTNVFSYDRSEFDAEGINVRAFNVKPSMAMDFSADDNIYATDTNEVSDIITVYNPKVVAASNWSRHDLTITAEGLFGEYSSRNKESYQDHNLSAEGLFDISRETYVTADLQFNNSHEDRGSADDLNGVTPTEYDETVVALGFNKGLNRVSLSVDADMRKLDYDDVYTAAGAELDNDARDRREYELSARAGYEIIPEYEAFLRTTMRKRDYDNIVGVNRNNHGYEVNLGTAIDLTSKVRGEVFAGYLHNDYSAATLSSINTPVFGASLLWKPTGLTSVETSFNQTVEETTISASTSGYISTGFDVRLEHEFRRNVLFSADLGYSNLSYEGAAAGTAERDDDLLNAGVGVKYLINKRLSASAGYAFEDRDSNTSGQDYSRNKFMLNLRGAL